MWLKFYLYLCSVFMLNTASKIAKIIEKNGKGDKKKKIGILGIVGNLKGDDGDRNLRRRT